MSHYICLDVGGTTTRIGLINEVNKTIGHQTITPTVRGLNKFPLFLSNCINQYIDIGKKEKLLIHSDILIAMPGNFKTGRKVLFKEGSGRQLITPTESFPDRDVTQWLTEFLPNDKTIVAINDAKAQAIGSIHTSWRDSFKQSVLLYIGPGTGLGGAIVSMGNNSTQFEFISDGHIYDILVEIQGQTMIAEDILSGRGIYEHTGKQAKELNDSHDLLKDYQHVITNCTECLNQLITKLKNQSAIKMSAKHNWSESVQQKVAKFNAIILGGSIGTKGSISNYLVQEIENNFDYPVIKPEHSDKNALVGAVLIAEKN